MLFIILKDLLEFSVAIAGLALPVWPLLKWTRNGVERLSLAIAAGVIIGYLTLLSLYLGGLSLRWFWLLPIAGLVQALFRPAGLAGCMRDPAVRSALACWLLLALWCLGWQSLVVSYSGGGWAGDWVEHYDRAQFFLSRWPVDTQFLGIYPLPARPPLANLWTAGLLAQTGGGFAHYQILTTLFSCLVIFPLTVLLQRWRSDRRAVIPLLVLLMVSPLFIQNATFPWTKLASAFFVLLAITQLSPSAGEPTRARLTAGAVLLAGGMLAHYSAGPWICALGIAGAWNHRRRWLERTFQNSVLLAAFFGGLLLLSWVAWSLTVYGPTTTFTANTATGLGPQGTVAARAMRAAGNLWHTVAPMPPDCDVPLLKQSSPLGQWRENAFALYQLKLPFAFGSIGGAALLWLLSKTRRSSETVFWAIVVPAAVAIGTATVGQEDRFGLTHISLQPLVLLGLVWLAAQADQLPRWLARLWAAGLALDFALGILLQFTIQSLWLDRWLHPGLSPMEHLTSYTNTARVNWHDKSVLHLTFLADLGTPTASAVLLLATGAAVIMLHRQASKSSPS